MVTSAPPQTISPRHPHEHKKTRYYFRCMYPGCTAKKQMQWTTADITRSDLVLLSLTLPCDPQLNLCQEVEVITEHNHTHKPRSESSQLKNTKKRQSNVLSSPTRVQSDSVMAIGLQSCIPDPGAWCGHPNREYPPLDPRPFPATVQHNRLCRVRL